MKKLFLLLASALFLASCQTKETKKADSVSTDTTKYPYAIEKMQSWQMNTDSKNALTAMNLIKTFENLDTASMGKILSDSVLFDLDGYQFKGTKSEFLKEIQREFAKMSSFKIKMLDFESVINTDKSEEWVSLWYKQISTTKDGKSDTIGLYNDIKLKDGKVVRLSEYVQHPAKK
ncbi:hypothetical protein [Pedobacter jamesrossensis]|uniref:SnoaL-like domain-containing protein n=1 Tax=Pedobacter jamesrossensis TaxID=1908238 RepID=A0ABV8NHL0_9SPHI